MEMKSLITSVYAETKLGGLDMTRRAEWRRLVHVVFSIVFLEAG